MWVQANSLIAFHSLSFLRDIVNFLRTEYGSLLLYGYANPQRWGIKTSVVRVVEMERTWQKRSEQNQKMCVLTRHFEKLHFEGYAAEE